MKKTLVPFAVVVAFVCGIMWQSFQNQPVLAQTENKIIIRAFGTANSSERPEESKTFAIYSEKEEGFYIVPEGKKLVITDMMLDARDAKQDIIINLAQRSEERDLKGNRKHKSLLQVSLKAGNFQTNNLCTGYVIHSGNSIVGWTNAGLEAKQIVFMNFTGYLIDESAEN